MKYYHIQKQSEHNNNWSVNQEIETNDDDNTFIQAIIRGIDRYKYQINSNERFFTFTEKQLAKTFNDRIKADENNHVKWMNEASILGDKYRKVTLNLLSCNLQYYKWIREKVFEEVRLNNYINKPSRKKCIWLCSEDLVEYWHKRICSNTPGQIMEVEVDSKGILHEADANFVEIDSFGINEIEKQADDYWNGLTNDQSKLEILFEGKLKVTKVFKSISQFEAC